MAGLVGGGERLWLRLTASTSYSPGAACFQPTYDAAGSSRLEYEKQNASLETVFGVVHGRAAIRKVAAILDDDRDTRPDLKSLRKKAESSSSGAREQRDALLEDW